MKQMMSKQPEKAPDIKPASSPSGPLTVTAQPPRQQAGPQQAPVQPVRTDPALKPSAGSEFRPKREPKLSNKKNLP